MQNKKQTNKTRQSDIFLTPVMTASLGFTHRSILEKTYVGIKISDRHDTMLRNYIWVAPF